MATVATPRMTQGEAVHALKRLQRVAATLAEIRMLEPKSMLADCAYQGPPPKKWVRDTARFYDGYNACLSEVWRIIDSALAEEV